MDAARPPQLSPPGGRPWLPPALLAAYRSLSGQPDPGRQRRLLLALIHVAVALWRAVRQDRIAVRAATLSYTTLVAMVPVLVLAGALMGPLGLLDGAAVRIREAMYETVLADSVSAVGPWVEALVGAVDLQTLGLLGFLGVLLTGSRLYLSVEQAYNEIFKVRIQRRWLLRIVLFYSVVTLGPLLLALGFLATSAVGRTLPANILGRAVPVGLATALFVLAIKLLPQLNVRWRAAVAGGLLSAVLFELLKEGFNAYTGLLGAADSAARLYGSIWLVPVFLLYTYALWLVVLVGVELAWVVQNAGHLLEEVRDRLRRDHLWRVRSDPLFALQVMVTVAAEFMAGSSPVTTEAVAGIVGAPGRVVAEAVDTLEAAGLLARADSGGWLPSRPLDRLTGAQVLTACRAVSVPDDVPSAPGAGALHQALEAMAARLDVPLSELATAAGPGR